MGTPVSEFIKNVHSRYNVKYALTVDRLRRLRGKLKAADIAVEVTSEDENLATDIILEDYKMASSSIRTAFFSDTTSKEANPSMKHAGMCPRCSHSMQYAKLATAQDARYCSNCHVCVVV